MAMMVGEGLLRKRSALLSVFDVTWRGERDELKGRGRWGDRGVAAGRGRASIVSGGEMGLGAVVGCCCGCRCCCRCLSRLGVRRGARQRLCWGRLSHWGRRRGRFHLESRRHSHLVPLLLAARRRLRRPGPGKRICWQSQWEPGRRAGIAGVEGRHRPGGCSWVLALCVDARGCLVEVVGSARCRRLPGPVWEHWHPLAVGSTLQDGADNGFRLERRARAGLGIFCNLQDYLVCAVSCPR